MSIRKFPAETRTVATISHNRGVAPLFDRDSRVAHSKKMAMHDDGLSPEAMLAFYQRLYPFKSIFHWLNHEPAPARLFVNREFAFTLQGDVYLRYNSFANADELKKQVCALNPTRFEIGPMYSARVSFCTTNSHRLVCEYKSFHSVPYPFSREIRKRFGRRHSNRFNASSSSIST